MEYICVCAMAVICNFCQELVVFMMTEVKVGV